ncbi:MAG: hypothetical protein V4487_03900 [Chlamydiota bacterium]
MLATISRHNETSKILEESLPKDLVNLVNEYSPNHRKFEIVTLSLGDKVANFFLNFFSLGYYGSGKQSDLLRGLKNENWDEIKLAIQCGAKLVTDNTLSVITELFSESVNNELIKIIYLQSGINEDYLQSPISRKIFKLSGNKQDIYNSYHYWQFKCIKNSNHIDFDEFPMNNKTDIACEILVSNKQDSEEILKKLSHKAISFISDCLSPFIKKCFYEFSHTTVFPPSILDKEILTKITLTNELEFAEKYLINYLNEKPDDARILLENIILHGNGEKAEKIEKLTKYLRENNYNEAEITRISNL